MHREVFALLYNDNKDAPPLLPTDTGAGYKQAKARLGMKKVRHWEWTPFVNPARKDNAAFHHWRRVSDEPKEYPFAKFNKQLNIQQYTANEYNMHLKSNNPKWSKLQTDHLFELANRFDLRFVTMADRWDRANCGTITVEDLKERYYEVTGILTKIRGSNATSSSTGSTTASTTTTVTTPADKKIFVFDAEHERKRKEQLRKLFDRTPKQIEEEQMLINELKKIEARKKERDRKTQDLQKLISQADQQGETPPAAANARKHDKKLNKKRTPNYVRPSRVDSVVNVRIFVFRIFTCFIIFFFCRLSKVLALNLMIYAVLVYHYDRKK